MIPLANKAVNGKTETPRRKKIAVMCRECISVIDELFAPLDAANRFINLALQNTQEDSQIRQFLLESKEGIKISSVLLKKLDDNTRRIEREIRALDLT